ncbi:MAG TPA: hypothetical protein VGK88_04710 [bacterium]|jgi:hypothetical protein
MEITVSEQKVFMVHPRVTDEAARERAVEQKGAAFGSVARLLLRPRGEEIKIVSIGKRFDPIWHVIAHKHVVFDRGREYRVPVADGTVQGVTVKGDDYQVAAGPPRHFIIRGVEHCIDDARLEKLVDAVGGADIEAKAVLAAPREEIVELADFAPPDAIVVPPDVRASMLVQTLVQQLVKPYEADQLFEEMIEIEQLHLIYHPVYAIEYTWEAKGKKAMLELDAVGGEVTTGSRAFQQQMRRIFNREVLFDLGAESVNLIVPGGAIALKIGKAVVDHQRRQKGG